MTNADVEGILAVTVVAAVTCDEGIAIASDTYGCDGQLVKTCVATKLFDMGNGCVVGIAGSAPDAIRIVEGARKVLRLGKGDNPATVLRQCAVEHYRDSFSHLPPHEQRSRFGVQVLVACAPTNGSPALSVLSSEDEFREISNPYPGLLVIGALWPAYYIGRTLKPDPCSIEQAKELVVFMVSETKAHVHGVDGETKLMVASNGTVVDVPKEDVCLLEDAGRDQIQRVRLGFWSVVR